MEWTVAGNRPRIIIASKHSFSPSFLPSISPSFSSSFSSSAFSRSTPFFSRFSLSFFPPRFSSLYVRVSFRFVPLSTLSGSRPFYSTVDADDASVLSPKSKIPTETGEACTLEYFASLVFYEDDCETFNFWELLIHNAWFNRSNNPIYMQRKLKFVVQSGTTKLCMLIRKLYVFYIEIIRK